MSDRAKPDAEREQPIAEQMGHSEHVAALVKARAPRLFATVVTKQGADAEIIGWGMEFDDSAFMITVDGRNQYFLAEAENALMYVRGDPDASADLVWVAPAAPAAPAGGESAG